jgi:hypothetical protein
MTNRLLQKRTNGSSSSQLTYLPTYLPYYRRVGNLPRPTQMLWPSRKHVRDIRTAKRRYSIAEAYLGPRIAQELSRTTRISHRSLRRLFVGSYYQPTYKQPPSYPTIEPRTQPNSAYHLTS